MRIRPARPFVHVALAACLALSFVGAANAAAPRAESPRARTIVVVSIDGARADLDLQPRTLPAFTAFANEGVRFDHATTPTPLTLPATASLLTGQTPAHHGLKSEGIGGFREKTPTLAARLASAGFVTLGLPGDPLANARTGIARGFQSYRRDAPLWADSTRVDSALAFLAGPGRRFVWLGLSLGRPVEAWRRYFGADLDSTAYLARARTIDECLTRLERGLARANRDKDAVVVVVGTHGLSQPEWPLAELSFDEPSMPGHGLDLSEAALRVPLVFGGPLVAARRGAHRPPSTWTSTLDVAPTVLEAAGVSSAGCDGVSLWPVIAGAPLPARVLTHETDVERAFGWQPRAAARIGDQKLERFGTQTLLLHATDRDLPAAPADAGKRLLDALPALPAAKTGHAPASSAGAAAALRDAENQTAIALRAAFPKPGVALDSLVMQSIYALSRENPKNLDLLLESAVMGSLAGSDDAAAAVFLKIANKHPEFPEATLAYGDHLIRHDHTNFVTDQMLKVPTHSPFAIEAMWRDVIARIALLDFAGADSTLDRNPDFCGPPGRLFRGLRTSVPRLAELRASVAAHPDTERFRLDYGRALGEFGLYDAAYQQLNQARLLDLADPTPNLLLGDFLYSEGKFEAARNSYQRVVDLNRDDSRGWIGIADCWLAQDRKREALTPLQRAAETAPRDARVRYNLACVLASQGEVDRAEAELERAIDLGYDNWAQIESDEDLVKVRTTEAYGRKARAAARP
jgi:Flp pilus assembly protein TadD